jgi:hypothetical protein
MPPFRPTGIYPPCDLRRVRLRHVLHSVAERIKSLTFGSAEGRRWKTAIRRSARRNGRVTMHLRVLTLNIWNEEGDPRRLDLLNRELRRLAPDLVALQEVVYTPERNQLDTLLDGTDLYRVVCQIC